MKPLFLLGSALACLGLIAAPLAADQSADKKAADDKGKAQAAQQAWERTISPGRYLLSYEQYRTGIGLSEKQKQKMQALAEKAQDLWAQHSEKSTADRQKVSEAAWKILTESQRETLLGMKTVSGHWFTTVSYSKSLDSIGIDEKQQAKIKAIIDAHNKERSEAFKSVSKPDPKAAERARKNYDDQKKLLETTKKKVQDMLGKDRFEDLLMEVARTRFQSITYYDRYRKELELTEKQAEKIDGLVGKRTEAWKEISKIEDMKERNTKWAELQRKISDEAFDTLTEKQKKQISGMSMVQQAWFYSLSYPGAMEKIDLPENLKAKLGTVMKDYQEVRRKAYQPDPKSVERSREVREKYTKMVEKAKGEVRAVLSDEQFDALLVKIAKNQLPYSYKRQDVAKELDLSEKQEEKLEAMTKKLNQSARDRSLKIADKRKAIFEKVDAMLTETQKQRLIEKVKASFARGQGGQGGQGGR